MTDKEIIDSFKDAYKQGADYLVIHSRRQDIGLAKCERGVTLGYLEFVEYPIDDQETHYRYYWTPKARKEFK